MKRILLAIALTSTICGAAFAAEGLKMEGTTRSITLPRGDISLKPGEGMELTHSYCSICHSLDYITTQHKFNPARWQAEVNKMVKVFGAPIDEATAKTIAAYISAAYGSN